MSKPELLLPVGNVASFFAAVQGGADAVYLGLKQFNARNRAVNFTKEQLIELLYEAKKAQVKIYVTLNTVLKNSELPALIDLLAFLNQTDIGALIIQDWGTFYLLKKYFPKLVVHASTQMGNHNSAGAEFSRKVGFERVILARELTLNELKGIQQNTSIETEVFVHGALCYSFSGMCLFSSYLGGAGANRGMCAQPCRRFYSDKSQKKLIFSLKDNELIDFIPKLSNLGVNSLKVEGRLKSAEYVYRVASAYRMVLDNPNTINEAKQLLALDLGREKTQWFYNNKVSKAISMVPGTGIPAGSVLKIEKKKAIIKNLIPFQPEYRLRVRTQSDVEPITFTIDKVIENADKTLTIFPVHKNLLAGDELSLVGTGQYHFQTEIKINKSICTKPLAKGAWNTIKSELQFIGQNKAERIYMRINNLNWLPFVNFQYINYLIVQPTRIHFESPENLLDKISNVGNNLWIELPQFIPEKNLELYRESLIRMTKKGCNKFVLSHLSQKELLPSNAVFGTNENVYCYNDAAAKLLVQSGAKWLTSPFENEMENLFSGTNRDMVIPLYFYPKLFFSRQPVSINSAEMADDKNKYRREIRNGITHILPKIPVALLQYKSQLATKGFNQFLIDLSFEEPSKATLKRIFTKFKKSENPQPSTTFNFKKGMR
jgi:putative protease